jgi:hypothetical protein
MADYLLLEGRDTECTSEIEWADFELSVSSADCNMSPDLDPQGAI